MRRWWPTLDGTTPGERLAAAAYLLIMALGVTLAAAIAARIEVAGATPLTATLYDGWIALAGGIGAGLGLHAARPALSRPSAAAPFLGAGILFLAGSVIAGTLALPIYGTMFGPMALAVLLAASPVAAMSALGTVALATWLLRHWQAERDSIFMR